MELLPATPGIVSLQPTFCVTEECVDLHVYQSGLKLRTWESGRQSLQDILSSRECRIIVSKQRTQLQCFSTFYCPSFYTSVQK